MNPLRVLLVEDSEDDALLLLRELRRGGYKTIYERVETAAAWEAALGQSDWDLAIADYSLPHFSGIEALKLLKEKGIDLPFLIVSGTINEEMAVAAMKAGAHDYLMKDNLARLVPAVERELRDASVRRERKAAEEQIREQAALLEVAQDAIFVLDLQDSICFWNKSAERLYGFSATEALGCKAAFLLFAEPPSKYLDAQQILAEKGEWQGEFHQLTKDKKSIIVESRWKLVRDCQGQPKSILVANTDITEKKQIQSQFLRAQRLESLGTLAGGIAHDLNNVLAPILLSVEILKNRFPDEKSLKILTSIEGSAQRGADIVRQVLAFARGVEGDRQELQLKHLIREIVQIAKGTFPKSIEIILNIPKDLWAISGDATQLQQVLLNLCVNARDAMPHGGILKIKSENIWIDENYARLHLNGKPGAYVLLTVSDTGTGIPPDLIDKIFEPFFTTKPVDRGTGLGLSTVLGIVKSHGGFINVSSKVGEGTTFQVYLPAIGKTDRQQTEIKSDKLPLGKGELVLVVDDEYSIRHIAKETLEDHGYRVLTAKDGAEAVALYLQHQKQVRVAVVDMKMPIMDGSATIHALRTINSQVKIIAVSGFMAELKKIDLPSSSAEAVLQKPFTTPKLLKTLFQVLSTD